MNRPNILFEDEHIIVLHKPSGIATQTMRVSELDLYNQVRNYLKGGYVAIINRLDQPVEGIVLMAKDQRTASLLSKQLTGDIMEKRYRASVYLSDDKKSITDTFVRLTDYLIQDKKTNTSRICSGEETGSKLAELEYRLMSGYDVRENDRTCLLDIRLLTGRHHQIRLQLSHAGMPILGDTKYGTEQSIAYSREQKIRTVSLCAYSLTFMHPVSNKKMTVTL